MDNILRKRIQEETVKPQYEEEVEKTTKVLFPLIESREKRSASRVDNSCCCIDFNFDVDKAI
jgi:hypothetical protein